MNRTGRMLFRHVSSLPFLSKTKAPWMCPVCTPPLHSPTPLPAGNRSSIQLINCKSWQQANRADSGPLQSNRAQST
jgi:hypothetical protein